MYKYQQAHIPYKANLIILNELGAYKFEWINIKTCFVKKLLYNLV